MKTFEDALLIAWPVMVVVGLVWMCHRDAPAVRQYLEDTGGDDLVIPPGPGPGRSGESVDRA